MTNGWVRRPLRSLADIQMGRQRSPDRDAGPNMTPYLRAANVQDGYLDLTDVKEMDFTPAEQVNFALRPGDILLTEGSGSIASIGATAVWDGQLDGIVCYQNHLIRLRARDHVDPGFLAWWARHAFGTGLFATLATGANIFNLGLGNVAAISVALPDLSEQRGIAAYLNAEVGAIESLLASKRQLIRVLEEKVDSLLLDLISASSLGGQDGTITSHPLKRHLEKLNRRAANGAMVVTAFRDGQVTARSHRRAEGFTESWTTGAKVQGVRSGDVVIHGLDGFAGAIGTAEVDGVCSPIYHVTRPIDGGDAHFYGRLLRLLATTGYLGNFATSTRERAVDFRNWDLFGSIPIPAVELREQLVIGDLLRLLRPAQALVERSERLLLERRQALITAAVTGQLEIPGVAA